MTNQTGPETLARRTVLRSGALGAGTLLAAPAVIDRAAGLARSPAFILGTLGAGDRITLGEELEPTRLACHGDNQRLLARQFKVGGGPVTKSPILVTNRSFGPRDRLEVLSVEACPAPRGKSKLPRYNRLMVEKLAPFAK